jgi:hypothetical protein
MFYFILQVVFSLLALFVLLCRNAFLVWCSPTCLFFFCCQCFWYHIQEFIVENNVMKFYTMCFCGSFIDPDIRYIFNLFLIQWEIMVQSLYSSHEYQVFLTQFVK